MALIDPKLLLAAKQAVAKRAFVPMGPGGPMPPGGAPMDPAMMGGAPPMDPSMMGMPPGAPPMDPAMMGMPPMDPSMMGMPMDPAMMGAPPPPPPPGGEGGGGGAPLTEDGVRRIIEEVLAGNGKGGEGGKGKSTAKVDVGVELKQVKLMLAKLMDMLNIPLSASEVYSEEDSEEQASSAKGPAGGQGEPKAPGPAGNIQPPGAIAPGLLS